MPHAIVNLWPGKSEQQKQKLADAITENIVDILGYGEESVSVGIDEVSSSDWAADVFEPDIKGKSDTLYKKPGYSV